MSASVRPSQVFFAAAMVALGVTGLVNGDFALVWQDVPAHLPGRTALAYACAVVEVALGVGLLWKTAQAAIFRALFAYMLLWFVLLALPPVVRSPLDAGTWGTMGEIGSMLAGAGCLLAAHGARSAGFRPGNPGVRAGRGLLIIALAGLAAEVIVDAAKARNAIMQPWLQSLPHPWLWACLTGVCSIATAVALLFDVMPRLAGTLEAVMVVLIGLVYWAPDLYTGRTAVTAFIITMLVAAGIWLVADTYRGPRPTTGAGFDPAR